MCWLQEWSLWMRWTNLHEEKTKNKGKTSITDRSSRIGPGRVPDQTKTYSWRTRSILWTVCSVHTVRFFVWRTRLCLASGSSPIWFYSFHLHVYLRKVILDGWRIPQDELDISNGLECYTAMRTRASGRLGNYRSPLTWKILCCKVLWQVCCICYSKCVRLAINMK